MTGRDSEKIVLGLFQTADQASGNAFFPVITVHDELSNPEHSLVVCRAPLVSAPKGMANELALVGSLRPRQHVFR